MVYTRSIMYVPFGQLADPSRCLTVGNMIQAARSENEWCFGIRVLDCIDIPTIHLATSRRR